MPVIADASNSVLFGFDHINRNAPVLIRTPKLTRFEPAQYWGGGPPGNSVVLNPFFLVTETKHSRFFANVGVKRWIQHHTVPGWSPTPVLSGLKPR